MASEVSELESVSNDLSREMKEYWSTNPELRIKILTEPETISDARGQFSVVRYLNFRVEDRKDPAVDVAFRVVDGDLLKVWSAFGKQAVSEKPIYAVIWTTTPWTLPANQALNVHPELTYNLVDTEKGLLILAAELQETCLKRFGLSGRSLGSCQGKALENIRFRHPFYDRAAPVYRGESVTTATGRGIVDSSPAYGGEDNDS